jgi:hypothetical protein
MAPASIQSHREHHLPNSRLHMHGRRRKSGEFEEAIPVMAWFIAKNCDAGCRNPVEVASAANDSDAGERCTHPACCHALSSGWTPREVAPATRCGASTSMAYGNSPCRRVADRPHLRGRFRLGGGRPEPARDVPGPLSVHKKFVSRLQRKAIVPAVGQKDLAPVRRRGARPPRIPSKRWAEGPPHFRIGPIQNWNCWQKARVDNLELQLQQSREVIEKQSQIIDKSKNAR